MNAPRWEHAFETYNPYASNSWRSPAHLLDTYSAEGWELVSHAHDHDWITFAFKRPLPDEHAPAR
ncbi:hypothetical protein [Spirillospora sp. NPDC029432]|uniref:hypothetical protein n=1 Tax=Spirillospora sp. NPDC029432 TaxID=3154599 RepID=UPI003456A84D